MQTRKRLKIYVGWNTRQKEFEVFRSAVAATEQTHGKWYGYAIGPFRTLRAAKIMALYGGNNNPHLACVEDAEKLAKYSRLEPEPTKYGEIPAKLPFCPVYFPNIHSDGVGCND